MSRVDLMSAMHSVSLSRSVPGHRQSRKSTQLRATLREQNWLLIQGLRLHPAGRCSLLFGTNELRGRVVMERFHAALGWVCRQGDMDSGVVGSTPKATPGPMHRRVMTEWLWVSLSFLRQAGRLDFLAFVVCVMPSALAFGQRMAHSGKALAEICSAAAEMVLAVVSSAQPSV